MAQPGQIVHATQSSSLADILERILDKGIVIAGDIKIRLLIASVDKAKEMGIDWWESDPALSSRAGVLEQENSLLRERLDRLEASMAAMPS